MKKIIVLFLFSLIGLVAYSQRENEYGLKLVKNIRCYEPRIKNDIYYSFEYNDKGETKSLKIYGSHDANDDSLIQSYDLSNGKMKHKYYIWDGYKDVLVTENVEYTFNDKGHITHIQHNNENGSIERWRFKYDTDISIYNENLVEIEFTDPYFPKLLKGSEPTWYSKKYSYQLDLLNYLKYEKKNDTNINLMKLLRHRNSIVFLTHLYMTSWLPYYSPYLPMKWEEYKDGETYERFKYEYYYEDDNLIKIKEYLKRNNDYILECMIEIEYQY